MISRRLATKGLLVFLSGWLSTYTSTFGQAARQVPSTQNRKDCSFLMGLEEELYMASLKREIPPERTAICPLCKEKVRVTLAEAISRRQVS